MRERVLTVNLQYHQGDPRRTSLLDRRWSGPPWRTRRATPPSTGS
jgi:hypothetical protein